MKNYLLELLFPINSETYLLAEKNATKLWRERNFFSREGNIGRPTIEHRSEPAGKRQFSPKEW
jgi:hypothetical protein